MNRAFPFISVPERPEKPRKIGLTIVSDHGLSVRETLDLLEVAGEIIDYAKFDDHSGMITRYTEEWIKEKNRVYAKNGVKTFPGGVTFEIAFIQGKAEAFLRRVKELGFSCVEISDDVIEPIPLSVKKELLSQALSQGLEVMMEVGRKLPEKVMDKDELVGQVRSCLDMGIDMVTIEVSEIDLIRQENPETLKEVVKEIGLEHLVFEAGPGRWPILPAWLVMNIDPNINLENIDADERVIALEGMRRGLHREVNFKFFSSLRKKR